MAILIMSHIYPIVPGIRLHYIYIVLREAFFAHLNGILAFST